MSQTAAPNQPITDQQRKALASITPPKKNKDQRTSTQNHLMFSEVRDNIVVMRDSSLRMVILASSLNFDLKSARERDAIEFSFQGFLNGLHFPVQIIVRSRKIDLDGYLTRLEGLQAEQENQLLAGLMEDYIYNIKGLLEDVNIMAKSFYVVVPYFVQTVSKDNIASKISKLLKANDDIVQTDLAFAEHKRDLLQRTNLVAQGLAQIGIRAAVLGTQELIELYYGSYNIDESQNQPLGDVNDVQAPVVERGGEPPRPSGVAQRAAEPADLFSAAAHVAPTMHAAAPQPTVAQQAPTPVAAPVRNPVIQATPAAVPTGALPVPAPQPAAVPPSAAPAPASAPVNNIGAAQPGQTVQINPAGIQPPAPSPSGGQK